MSRHYKLFQEIFLIVLIKLFQINALIKLGHILNFFGYPLNHHVCCHGKPDQVSADPAFLELFGANVSTNLAVYTHNHNHEHDIAGEVKAADE